MSTPGVEMRWTSRTHATYAADWALFLDWCDATDYEPLPAGPTTVLAFLADCPAAQATRRRRVIAIDHHHTTVDHPPPGADPRVRDALGRPPVGLTPVAPEIRDRVNAALRLLPSRGWTGGLFGQRDRCLLVLSQLAQIPHRHLAQLMAGDVTVTAGVATITIAGQVRTVGAVDDPVLCGPCAIARWLQTHDVIVTKIATPAVSRHLRKLESLISTSPHTCRDPIALDDRSRGHPLLAPVNQWGHAPFPLSPMSPHAVSRQARDLLNGTITVHRDLDGAPTTDEPTPPVPQTGVVRTGHTKRQVRAAWDRRRADLADLAGIADELADVDRRAAELDSRIAQLLTMAARCDLPMPFGLAAMTDTSNAGHLRELIRSLVLDLADNTHKALPKICAQLGLPQPPTIDEHTGDPLSNRDRMTRVFEQITDAEYPAVVARFL